MHDLSLMVCSHPYRMALKKVKELSDLSITVYCPSLTRWHYESL